VGWRETLTTLKTQFEAQAARSTGLHHLMVEVADDERNKMMGPDWFVQEADLDGKRLKSGQAKSPWHVVNFSGMPWLQPHFRGVQPDEAMDGVADERIVRDKSDTPRAIFVPSRLLTSYLCGDATSSTAFLALAEAASGALTGADDFADCPFAEDMSDLFRIPRGGLRQVFGEVVDPPQQFMSRGWDAGVLLYPAGVLIDTPLAEQQPDASHWLLLLHRLAWRRVVGSPLRGQRLSWHENMTVPYEWVLNGAGDVGLPNIMREKFSQISTTSYYSTLGERNRPIDVNLASVFAIDLLLSNKPKAADCKVETVASIDYSQEPWHKLPMPTIVEAAESAASLKKRLVPRVVILTATTAERDTVLKHLEPLGDAGGITRLFHVKNTYFIGRLGKHSVVLCMCSMGASGPASSQIVAGEVVRLWRPSAIIMAGIAFGRTADRQRLGDVLISERIIAYEPERVGTEATIPRGHHFQAGAQLYNAFRNADVDWNFRDPNDVQCTPHFGAILSGDKLVDNPDFKSELFEKHPNAIGGEMEGIGVAACAQRENCEWILVKGICDWADGAKSDNHQSFAAAAAVSFVRHVLNQAGAI
jgi:nucleoside phosphorylase